MPPESNPNMEISKLDAVWIKTTASTAKNSIEKLKRNEPLTENEKNLIIYLHEVVTTIFK